VKLENSNPHIIATLVCVLKGLLEAKELSWCSSNLVVSIIFREKYRFSMQTCEY